MVEDLIHRQLLRVKDRLDLFNLEYPVVTLACSQSFQANFMLIILSQTVVNHLSDELLLQSVFVPQDANFERQCLQVLVLLLELSLKLISFSIHLSVLSLERIGSFLDILAHSLDHPHVLDAVLPGVSVLESELVAAIADIMLVKVDVIEGNALYCEVGHLHHMLSHLYLSILLK